MSSRLASLANPDASETDVMSPPPMATIQIKAQSDSAVPLDASDEAFDLIDRLRDHDAAVVRLDISLVALRDYDEWHWADYLNAVRNNKSVRTVHLSGHHLGDVLNEKDVVELLEAIGCLANLRELFVFHGDCSFVTAARVAQCLVNARELHTIMLWNIVPDATLAAALRNQPGLSRLSLSFAPQTLPYAALDVLVMGLAVAHQLAGLTLQCGHTKKQTVPAISTEAIGLLTSSTCLESLYLENVGLEDDHVDVIVESLRTNRQLKLLNMQHNQFSDDVLYSFAELLPVNDRLESLDVSGATLSAGGGRKLAQALTQNIKLTYLELEGTRERYADEFDVPLGHENTDWQRAIDYQLRLNRSGPSLHDNRKRFVNELFNVNDQVGALFHFVRSYPSHCGRVLQQHVLPWSQNPLPPRPIEVQNSVHHDAILASFKANLGVDEIENLSEIYV